MPAQLEPTQANCMCAQIEARALRKLRRKPQTFHKNLKEFIKPSKP